MSEANLPEYLKNLETLLGPSAKSSSLSLSNIGFGSMFTPPEQNPDKLRFILASTHIHQFTGYSKVSHGILTELAKQPWLDLTHFGFQKFHDLPSTFRPYPAGIDVIDVTAIEKPLHQGFGYNILPDVIRKKKPHVVMIYNDMAVVTQFIEAIRKSGVPRTFQL